MYTYKILQNYTQEMFHCSVLQFDKDSYMFNCCDGTQRNALDQGIKFIKIKNVFYNSSHSNCYIGTYGFIMSRGEQTFNQFISKSKEIAQQINDEKVTKFSLKNKIAKSNETNLIPQQARLFGPPDFSQKFKFSNYFCPVPLGKSIYIYDPINKKFKNDNIFTDKNLDDTYSEVSDNNVSVIPICTTNSENIYAMSYICIPTLKKAPFLVEKAKALGLKPGPAYAKLAAGETVFLDDGKEIKPEDVLGNPPPSSAILILYSPTKEHMLNLINNETLNEIINHPEQRKCVIGHVVHIAPSYDIINNEIYIKFIAAFGKDVQHIIDCKETNKNYMYNEGKMKIQVILNKVNSYLFPETKFTEENTQAQTELTLKNNNDILISDSVPGREYILYPHEKRGILNFGLYANEPYYFKSKNFSKYIKSLEKLTIEHVPGSSNNENISKVQPKITFLGTTSMKPCKYRNVTSILIHIPSTSKYVMFDCGEGTYQQILEHYGIKETQNILQNLSLISVSHKHGDHMLGLIKILCEIDTLITQTGVSPDNLGDNFMFIIVPNTIVKFVQNSIEIDIRNKKYFKVFTCDMLNPNDGVQLYQKNLYQNNPHENFHDIPREKEYKSIKEKIIEFRNKNSQIYNEMRNKTGIYFYAIEVFHCDESYGCFIENASDDINNYYKISFSGDTRPINNFFNYTMNSNLLIHEATFDDEMTNDAMDKMHSTIKEAIDLGKENGSKYIALTHFSPRYIKCYPYMERFDNDGVLLAHDYLTFYLDDLSFAFKYLKSFDSVIKQIENQKESIL